MSKSVDLIGDGAGLDESDAERVRRVVAVLGKERAAALFEEARARAARDGDPEAASAPAETLARHFFDLVWERADPAYVRWIFAPPEPPTPPIDEGESSWSPLLLDRPSPVLVVCVGAFAMAEQLGAALLAAMFEFGSGFNSESDAWTYRPIAWLLWPLFLFLALGCLAAAARSRSEWRWAWWLTALLAPWAWLILISAVLRVHAG